MIQVSKQGFTYVFDRKTGEPVWPIEERSVPQNVVRTEWTSLTQPFPTRPPAFELQGANEDNLIDFTPALRKQAAAQLQNFVHGPLFTAPSEKGTVYLPGNIGGANWGGAGFDPETGVLYVTSRTIPTVYRMVANDGARTNFRFNRSPQLSSDLLRIDDLSIFKPPYSRVTAIDMNRGEILWRAPLGNGPRNHPLLKDLNLPPLGDADRAGSVLITRTLLFVNAMSILGADRTSRWNDTDASQKMIFVFDKASGRLLHTVLADGLYIRARQ